MHWPQENFYASPNFCKNFTHLLGARRWRSDESARLTPMCPGFKSRLRRHMWVEFVVGSLLWSDRFSGCTPVFPSPQKPTFPNSNSNRNQANQVDEEPLCGCATFKSSLLLLLLLLLNPVTSFDCSFQLGLHVLDSPWDLVECS